MGEGGGKVSPRKSEIGAVDLAAIQAICVAPLRSVPEYNVAWLDITPFLPICLVQYASFKDNIPPEALQFPRVVRVEDRPSGLCISTIKKDRTLSTCD